ncbi:MAG: uroporphyrinogen decarboxylase family protein [Armatimonadia bacterium]
MTSRERLLAAFQLQPVDRLPINIRGVRAWDPDWVETRDPSYRPLIDAVTEHGDYNDTWGAPAGLFYSAADVTTTETWTEDRDDWIANYTLYHTPGGDLRSMYLSSKTGMPGMQMEFMVKDLADLDKVLSVPYEPSRPDCAPFFARVEEMSERGLVHCGIHNGLTMLHNLMGSELLAIWSLTDRPRLMELIWLFHRRCLDLVDYLLDQGVGPVFAMSGEEYVTPPLHSAHDFHEFVVEPEKELAEHLHARGGLLHIHCHGPLTHVLEDFLELGPNCLHPLEAPPMGDVTLEDAKRRIGHRICLEGNIQIGDLYAGKTEDIIAQIRHNYQITGNRGYILCPTASPHTPTLSDLTVRNYLAMIKTAASL